MYVFKTKGTAEAWEDLENEKRQAVEGRHLCQVTEVLHPPPHPSAPWYVWGFIIIFFLIVSSREWL